MIFDGKPTTTITVGHLEALVREGVQEDRFLDYKEVPYPQNSYGTSELVKDVSAFANTAGGYLIMGIREDGERRAKVFVNIDALESVRRSMIDRCMERIEPRVPELDIAAFEVQGRSILVCRVPESGNKPHCARPDREHHYFWRRYEDGNKLMSMAEIRECFEGDRVLREPNEVRREFSALRQQQAAAREAEQEVDLGNLFQLRTLEPFLQFVDDVFVSAIGEKPYYRLTATPIPINQLQLRDRRRQLLEALENPPQIRPRGWDLSHYVEPGYQQTPIGFVRRDLEYKHLRLLWNGHTEFWTEVDDNFFRINGDLAQRSEYPFLYPYAVSEPVANFIELFKRICQIAEHAGEVRLGLGFHNIRGMYLAPYAAEAWGYLHARGDAGRPYGPQPLGDDHLLAPAVTTSMDTLPGDVHWRLVSEVYYRFRYMDEHVPFFDQDHRFTLGERAA